MSQKTTKEINRDLRVTHGKNLIVDTIRKLTALARLPRLSKPQREESKALMRELREHGFTNADICVIVDDRCARARGEDGTGRQRCDQRTAAEEYKLTVMAIARKVAQGQASFSCARELRKHINHMRE